MGNPIPALSARAQKRYIPVNVMRMRILLSGVVCEMLPRILFMYFIGEPPHCHSVLATETPCIYHHKSTDCSILIEVNNKRAE